MTHRVSVLLGDGIGPELISQTLQVLSAACGAQQQQLEFDIHHSFTRFVDSLRVTHVGLKGPLDSHTQQVSPNQQLRKKFGLFLNVRPVKMFGNVDLLTVHHALHGEYVTEESLYTFLARAFSFVAREKRGKVTLAVKPQFFREDAILKEMAPRVAQHFPEIAYEDRYADTVALQLVRKPRSFDVILCNAVYGDILSDVAAALVGGRGFAPSGSYGKDYAVFEAIHGTAQHMSTSEANPIALFLSGAMLLRCISRIQEAVNVERAVARVIQQEGASTLGSSYYITERVLEELRT